MFSNLKINARLALAFGGLLLLFALALALSLWQVSALSDRLDRVSQLEQQVQVVERWVAATRLNVNRVLALAQSRNDAQVQAHFNPLIAKTTDDINTLQKALESAVVDEQGKAQLAQVGRLRGDYIAVRKKYFDALKTDPTGAGDLLKSQLMPAADAYMSAQETLATARRSEVEQLATQARREARTAMTLVLALAAVALAAGVGVAVGLSRSITVPLRQAVTVADSIANGDLSRTLTHDRGDELGALLGSLATMQTSLLRVIGQIRDSGEHIESASAEIAAGNHDLSSRTELAASSLQQTTSNIEQLTATVRQSADAAVQANQMAARAAEVAQRGGTVVGEVVTTMDAINDSSRKIHDIIGVIDGIAFQTNILALNAAVEAARAGEQGKGFAVVAGEVRSLAQRSAEAAREIKALIANSVDKVEDGSRLVQEAGTTMEDIVASVSRVTDIIGEIAAAAAEQRDGITGVNAAVSHLDDITQQNAALVEQSAAASTSLRDEALRLTQAIAVFRT